MYREPPPRSPFVYAGVSNSLVAFDRSSGERVWEARIDDGGSVHRLGFVEGHVVIALERAIACVVETSGDVLWARVTPFPVATLLVDVDRIVVAGTGRVACYDLRGEPLWQDELKGYGLGPVALGVPGNVVNVDHTG